MSIATTRREVEMHSAASFCLHFSDISQVYQAQLDILGEYIYSLTCLKLDKKKIKIKKRLVPVCMLNMHVLLEASWHSLAKRLEKEGNSLILSISKAPVKLKDAA